MTYTTNVKTKNLEISKKSYLGERAGKQQTEGKVKQLGCMRMIMMRTRGEME